MAPRGSPAKGFVAPVGGRGVGVRDRCTEEVVVVVRDVSAASSTDETVEVFGVGFYISVRVSGAGGGAGDIDCG